MRKFTIFDDDDNDDATADDDGVCADGDVYDYCNDYDDLSGCDNDNYDAAGGVA